MKQPTEDMQKKYAQLQHMENTLQEAQAQIMRLENQIQELAGAKLSLESLAATAPGEEILVPITNGMFIKATLMQMDPVLVNIGADTIIDKPRADALKLLEQQEQQMLAAHQRLFKAFTEMEEHAKSIEAELQKLIDAHESS